MNYQVNTNNNNCGCYENAEWHPEENVYMPDFVQCESCKCIEADQNWVKQVQNGEINDLPW